MDEIRSLGSIVLAAGRGSRMNMQATNKVALMLGDKPMVLHSIELLESVSIKDVVVVVGFAKSSVKSALCSKKITFADQKCQLGTAHALKCGLKCISPDITDVLIIQGDDSAFYTKQILSKLFKTHLISNAEITLLTLSVDRPQGLGRIVRDRSKNIVAIVEENDASDRQKLITEINPACYVMKVEFLKKYLHKVKKSPITGEYYLTRLIDLAIEHNEKIASVKAKNINWRGVNTPQELEEARKLLLPRSIAL